MPIKSVKIKISKNKKMRFFLMFQGSLDPKIRFLGQKVSSVALVQTDGRTDTKVNTEDTLSGFQEFSLQPIIKERSNYRTNRIQQYKNKGMTQGFTDLLLRYDKSILRVPTKGTNNKTICVSIHILHFPVFQSSRLDFK